MAETPDSYQEGDRVFAKIKGYPWWPAQVVNRVNTAKEEKYALVFFGSHDSAEVKLAGIGPFNAQNIQKYGKPPKPSAAFKAAMEEAENNVNLIGPADLEEQAAGGEIQSDGELQIDEGPPILEKEVKSPVKEVKATPKPPPARRLSKSTKRGSVGGAPSPSAEAAATPPQLPPAQPEIVSRSGRKIKPKRFADDEMGSPVTALHKAAIQSSIDEASTTPSAPKRAKKKSVATPTTVASPVSEVPKLEAASIPKSQQPKGGKPKVKQEAVAEAQSPSEGNTSGKVKSKPPKLTEVASESLTNSPQIGELEAPNLSEPPTDKDEPLNDSSKYDNSANKENSGGSWVNSAPSQDSASDDSLSPVPEIKQFKEVPISDESSMSGDSVKISLAVRKDTVVEIVYNHDKPLDLPSQKARVEWDMATAKNVLRIRETLESTDPTAAEILNLLAAAVEQKEKSIIEADERVAREKRSTQLAKLRLEGEVIEIIGDIINSLSYKAADCDRAIELLDRLGGHTLNPLILKKNPEIVEIIRKLQLYEGNGENWGLKPDELQDFDEKTNLIRDKAHQIYNNFKLIFGLPYNSKDFQTAYEQELEKFRNYCKRMAPQAILNLIDDPTEDSEDSYSEGVDPERSDSSTNDGAKRYEAVDDGSIDSVEMTDYA